MEHFGDMTHRILHRAVNLRDAAERIRILHMLLVAGNNLASLEDGTEYAAGLDLTLMRANLLDAIPERLDTSVERLQRDCSEEIEAVHQMPSVDKSLDSVRAHELCAVKQRQTLLRFKTDRPPAHNVQSLDALYHLTLVLHHSLADKRQEQIGKRGEVSRSAERSAVIDHWKNVVVVEIKNPLNRLHLDSGKAFGQSVGLEQKHQFYYSAVHRCTHRATVALHQILLKF